MKKFLLLFFISVSIQFSAQSLVLTQAGTEPIVGDDDSRYYLDTTAYTSGLPTSVTGSTCVWNYTDLKAQNPAFITQYLPPSAVTNSASFPGCTMVEKDVQFTLFLKSTTTPTTQTEIVGFTYTMVGVSISLSNSAIIAKYPISYGASQTDNASGTYTYGTINGPCSGNITTAADGTGTLNLPGGATLTNVLRVKSVQNLTFSQGLFPVGSVKQTTYNYYHASKKFPILNINHIAISLVTSSTPTLTSYATGNADVFVVGLKENSLDAASLSLYPNPFTSDLQLGVSEQLQPSDIKLYSQLGQIVYHEKYSTTPNFAALQSGIYFIEVTTNKGILRKKLIKE